MRYLLSLSLMLIVFNGRILAQGELDCNTFAQDAYIYLDAALNALDADEIDNVTKNIKDAQAELAQCDISINNSPDQLDENDTATNISDQTPSDNVPELESATPEPEGEISNGNYTVNPVDVDPSQSITFLRFSNLSPDVGNIDYYLAGHDTPIVQNLAYSEVTDIAVFNGGNLTFIARPAESGINGEQLGHVDWNFQGNSSWIVVAIGLQSEFSFFIEPISIVRTDYNEQARVRVVNLITSKQKATITTDSDIRLANGIGWVGIDDTMVTPDDYMLDVELDDGTKLDTFISPNFAMNTTYIILLIGMNTEDDPIKAIVLAHPENITRLKFISQKSEAVEIFSMPDGIELVDQLESGAETDWISVPSGALTLTLFSPDSGPDAQEIAAISRQLRPGRDITIVVDDNGLHIENELVTP